MDKYEKILFLIPLMFFLLLIRPYPLNIIYFLLGSVSLLLLRIKYPEEFGSHWCWISNFLGIIIILSKNKFIKL